MASSSEDEIEYEPEEFTLCGENLTITTVAMMPLSILSKLGGNNEVSGQKLWCGSVCLSEHLAITGFSKVAGAEVVELGAGTGAAGMLCSRRGAAKVWLTDHDVKCINHMTIDCTENFISNAEIVRLDWLRPSMDDITGRGGFNKSLPLVLIAGDVLYKSTLVEPFFATVKMLMQQNPESVMHLCHIPRAGVAHEIVVAGGRAQGLDIQKCSDEFRERVDTGLCPIDDINRAHCYEIRLGRERGGFGGFGRISVAAVTPFLAPSSTDASGVTKQDIDEKSFAQSICHVAKGLALARSKTAQPDQIGGVIVPGTTGEQHSLSVDEKKKLFKLAVDSASEFSISILAGVSATSTFDAVDLAKCAVASGCGGIMLGLPPYLRLSDAEATAYVEAVHATVPVNFPILLYNNVGRNGTGPSVEVLVSWFRRGLIWGIKHANVPHEVFIKESIEMVSLEPALRLYTGSDVSSKSLLTAASERKLSLPRFYGLTSIIGNVYPEETALMVVGLLFGEGSAVSSAESLHANLVEVASASLIGSSLPVGLKYAMRKLSGEKLGGWSRLPLGHLTEEKMTEIDVSLTKFNAKTRL